MRFELITQPRPDLSSAATVSPSPIGWERAGVRVPVFFNGGGGGTPVPPRNLYDETAGELKAKLDLQPNILAAESQYRPQYAGLDLQSIQALMEGTKAGTRQQQYTTMQHVPAVYRTDTGPGPVGGSRSMQQVLVTPAYDRPILHNESFAVPAQRGLLDLFQNDFMPANQAITNQANTASRSADINDVATLGPQATAAFRNANPQNAALMDTLNQQALSELNAGANLDPSLAREVQQSVRAGQSARGMGMGVNDMANESFFTAMQAEQLRRARQAFATGVVGLNQSNSADPFMTILGRPSTSLAQTNQTLGSGFSLDRSAGPQLFGSSVNPNDVFSSNFNAANANNISAQNNAAATNSAAIGGGAALAGSAILAVAL